MSYAQYLGAAPTIAIGPIQLEGRALLAPMSGISDLAMRRIARRFGAALVFSEMVAAETFLRGDAEASVRAEGEGLAPHAVQVVGCEASGFGRNCAAGWSTRAPSWLTSTWVARRGACRGLWPARR